MYRLSQKVEDDSKDPFKEIEEDYGKIDSTPEYQPDNIFLNEPSIESS